MRKNLMSRALLSLFGWVIALFLVTEIQAVNLTIAWDPNNEPDIAGYKFYYDDGTNLSNIFVTTNSVTVSNLVQGVTYTLYVTAVNTAGLESDPSAPIVYTVPISSSTAPRITAQPLSQTLNLGTSLTLSIQATGSNPLSYRWFRSGTVLAGATNATVQIGATQLIDAGNYYAIVSNTAGNATSTVATVTVRVSPSITTQPVNQTINAGTALNLSVGATGTAPLGYQWFKNGTSVTGATSANFQVASAQSTDAGSYYAVVSNAAGSATSTVATITVRVAPSITTQPLSQTINPGAALNLSVAASGTAPLAYQWFKNGSSVSGAISANIQIASAQSSDSGNYFAVVSNAAGTATSTVATITVRAAPSITTQPVSQTVNAGSVLNLSVAASGTAPLSYKWFRNGATVSGATSASFQVASTLSTDAGNYYAVVSNAAGSATSTVATVTVLLAPNIVTQPASQTINSGSALNLSVAANGTTPLTYQWFKNGTSVTGATSANFQIASAQSTDAGNYYAVVSNSAGSATSTVATVSVLLGPNIITQPASQTINPGSALNLSVAANGTTPLTYQWFKNGSSVTGATSANFQIASAQSADAGNYHAIVSNSAGSATSTVATVVIRVAPSVTTQPASVTISLGSVLNLSVGATGTAPLTYQWFRNGSSLAAATSASYQVASAQSTDAGNYYAIVSNAAGTATSAVATVTIGLAPSITTQPLSQAVGLGTTLNLSVAASGMAPMTYQWYRNGGVLSGITGAGFQIASIQSTDAGNYYAIVSNAAGKATSTVATVTISLAPSITTQPVSQTVNPGSAINLFVTAAGTGPLTYQWYRDGVSVAAATSANFQLSSAQSIEAGDYYAVVSNAAGSATSTVATVTVRVAPSITSQPLSRTLNPGASLNLAVVASGTAPLTYQWFRNGASIAAATSASFQIASVQSTDAGNYYAVVSNAAGSATSSVAIITIASAPLISLQPTNQTVDLGASFNLTIEAAGSNPLSYQWFLGGTNILAATNATFQVASAQLSDAGDYYVTVSNPYGSATSLVATVTVTTSTGTAPAITSQPVGQMVNSGVTVNLSIQATGTGPLAYQWFHDGAAIPGPASASFQIAAAQDTDAGDYYAIVTNSWGSATSTVATITVMVPPTIITQPQSQTVAIGAPLSLSVEAEGPALQYRWTRNNTLVPTATGPTLTIASVQSGDGGNYVVRVSNSAGSVRSTTARVTMVTMAAPTITTPPQDQNIALGNSLSLSVQATGSTPMSYQWSFNGSPISDATNQTFQIAAVQTNDAGVYSVTVSNPAGSASAAATVTIAAAPVVTSQPTSQTVAIGTQATFSVKAVGANPLAYQWFFNNVAIAGANSATLVISSVQTNNAGAYNVVLNNPAGNTQSTNAVLNVLAKASNKSNNGKGKTSATSPAYLTAAPNEVVVSKVGSLLVIQMVGSPGQIFDIQATDNLNTPLWITVASLVAADDGFVELTTDDPSIESMYFYRAVAR
jgi:hypothetical protein